MNDSFKGPAEERLSPRQRSLILEKIRDRNRIAQEALQKVVPKDGLLTGDMPKKLIFNPPLIQDLESNNVTGASEEIVMGGQMEVTPLSVKKPTDINPISDIIIGNMPTEKKDNPDIPPRPPYASQPQTEVKVGGSAPVPPGDILLTDVPTPKMGSIFAQQGINPSAFPKAPEDFSAIEIEEHLTDSLLTQDYVPQLEKKLSVIEKEGALKAAHLKNLFDTFVNRSESGSKEKELVLKELKQALNDVKRELEEVVILEEKITTIDPSIKVPFPHTYNILLDALQGVGVALEQTKDPIVRRQLAELNELKRRFESKRKPKDTGAVKESPTSNTPPAPPRDEKEPSLAQQALEQKKQQWEKEIAKATSIDELIDFTENTIGNETIQYIPNDGSANGPVWTGLSVAQNIRTLISSTNFWNNVSIVPDQHLYREVTRGLGLRDKFKELAEKTAAERRLARSSDKKEEGASLLPEHVQSYSKEKIEGMIAYRKNSKNPQLLAEIDPLQELLKSRELVNTSQTSVEVQPTVPPLQVTQTSENRAEEDREALPMYLQDALVQELQGEPTDPETRKKLIEFGYGDELSEIPASQLISRDLEKSNPNTAPLGNEPHNVMVPTEIQLSESPEGLIVVPAYIGKYPEEKLKEMIDTRKKFIKQETNGGGRAKSEKVIHTEKEIAALEDVLKKKEDATQTIINAQVIPPTSAKASDAETLRRSRESLLSPRQDISPKKPRSADEILSQSTSINWGEVQRQYDAEYNEGYIQKEIQNIQIKIDALKQTITQDDALLRSRAELQKTIIGALSSDVSKLPSAHKETIIALLQTDTTALEKPLADKKITLAELEKEHTRLTAQLKKITGTDRVVPPFIQDREGGVDQTARESVRPSDVEPESTSVPSQVVPQVQPNWDFSFNQPDPSASSVKPESTSVPSQPPSPEMSAFYEAILKTDRIYSLHSILVSEEYKSKTFGTERNAATGEEIANRLFSKIGNAKPGDEVNPYLFIPDKVIADKVREILAGDDSGWTRTYWFQDDTFTKKGMPAPLDLNSETVTEEGEANDETMPPPLPPSLEMIAFHREVMSQNSITNLCNLLISPEYKYQTFGTGKDTATGDEIANRIYQKITKAETDDNVNPYTFIPDEVVADKVREILASYPDTWAPITLLDGSISTKTFTKVEEVATDVTQIEETPLDPNVEAAVTEVETTVTRNAKPGKWARIRNFLARKPKVATGAFLMALLTGAVMYANSERGQEKATPILAEAETEATFNSTQLNASVGQLARGFDASTIGTFRLSETPATDTSSTPPKPGSLDDELPNVSQYVTSGGESTPAETEGAYSQAETYTVIPDTKEDNASIERPANFPTLSSLKEYLHKTGDLPAFMKVLSYARGSEERSADGRPNTRAYWWETMLMQKASDMLPNKASSRSRNLTRAYRSYHTNESGRDAIIELPNFDDNQFMASGQKFKDFDKWYNSVIVPITNGMSYEQKQALADEKLTLGEYLAKVVRTTNEVTGLHSLSTAELDAAQNFQTESVSPTTTPLVPPTPTPADTPERGVYASEVSDNTRWLEYALQGAQIRENMTQIEKQEWIAYNLQHVISAYERDEDELRHGSKPGYTLADLQYMRGEFTKLKTRVAELAGDDDSVFGKSKINDTDRIDDILEKIDTQIEQKQGGL